MLATLLDSMTSWLTSIMTMLCCSYLQNVYQFWVILVFGAHALGTVALLCLVPAKASRRAWAKLTAMGTFELCGGLRLRGPGVMDTSLRAACMLWPPGCFVSDATDAQGRLSCL